MMIDWITIEITFCSEPPRDDRAAPCTGAIRKRSTTPRSMSLRRPMPPQPAPNSAVIMTTPGREELDVGAAEWKPGMSTTRLNSAP